MNDQNLIDRILAGDASAERALYDAHVDRIFRLAYRMSGDDVLAQDLTQETFLRAFDRLASFRGEAAFSTWLHTVAVSVIINGLRKRKRRWLRERTAADPEEQGVVAAAPDQPDLRLRIEAAIDDLPEKLRWVFVMHDVEGYKHREIAAALGIPDGTSKARLSRARARLRETLTARPWWRTAEVES